MISDSINEIISEFNAKTTKYRMMDATIELRDRTYPSGTFCVKINTENFLIMFDDVFSNLNEGYQQSAVRALIYGIITHNIKAK